MPRISFSYDSYVNFLCNRGFSLVLARDFKF